MGASMLQEGQKVYCSREMESMPSVEYLVCLSVYLMTGLKNR